MIGNAGSNVKSQVRQFILNNFLMGTAVDIPDDASFMERHILDSTGVLELVTFIEQMFDVRVHDDEMIPENLDDLNNIERFVRQKRSGKAVAQQ